MLTCNNFFSAKAKCVSATFADFYKRVVSPFPVCRKISVCEHPTINENTNNRYTTSRPKK